MADFLDIMAGASKARVSQAKQREPESALLRRALDRADPPTLQLHPGRFDLIAEVKRHAPSAGALVDANDPDLAARQADAYVRGGVAAVSVLTEPDQFLGTLADVTSASGAVPVPVLRKDFLVDPYQVVEARAAGAGGVLLIVRMLDGARLGELLDAANTMRLFVLLEAFDEDDLARAADMVVDGADNVLLGLNTRDLATLQVDSDRLERLYHAFPEHTPRVAESGLESVEDIRRAARLGYQLALVGSALMRAAEPTKLVETMIRAGREEAMKLWASV
jgi:indole-3-glycerol phosphate synthase